MSAKLGFTTGLAVGLLAGSRAGRGLYDRSAAAATAVVNNPRVRRGASTALHKAGNAGSSVAGAAAKKVKDRSHSDGDDAQATTEGGADAECRSGGFRALREGIAGITHHDGHHHKHDKHDKHDGHHNGHDRGINGLNGGTRRQEAAGTSASGRRRFDIRNTAVSTPTTSATPAAPFVQTDEPGSERPGSGPSRRLDQRPD